MAEVASITAAARNVEEASLQGSFLAGPPVAGIPCVRNNGSHEKRKNTSKAGGFGLRLKSRLKTVARAFSVPLLHAPRAPVCLHASGAPVCAEKKGLGTSAETAA